MMMMIIAIMKIDIIIFIIVLIVCVCKIMENITRFLSLSVSFWKDLGSLGES